MKINCVGYDAALHNVVTIATGRLEFVHFDFRWVSVCKGLSDILVHPRTSLSVAHFNSVLDGSYTNST